MKRWLSPEEPSPKELEKYGFLFAYAIRQVNIENKRSRLASAAIAFTTGSLLTLLESNPSDLNIIGNYAVPVIINGVAQLRTERVDRRQVKRLENMGQVATSESHALLETLDEAGIPPPPIMQGDEIRKIFSNELE